MPPDVNRGWFFIPAELFAELANQGAERFTGALTGKWRPAGWLSTRATFGYDVVNRKDFKFFPTGQVADFTDNRPGVSIDNRFQISQTTVDLGGTARFQLSPAVGSKTSVGGQFFRDLVSGTFASGRGLAAGSSTIAGAANTERQQTTVESRSAGAYIEEEIANQGPAVRHRRPPVRRQQRLRQGLQRHDVSQGQRLLAGVRRAVLRPRLVHEYPAAPGRPRA